VVRKASFASVVAMICVVAFAGAPQSSAPIKLARHPDYHAGKIAFSLGKVVGVPTTGAVIGTGAYTLLDGSTIRTPASGVWTVTSQNVENYGVPPDVLVDNTPGDFIRGRDAQIEKAVDVLKADLPAKKTSTAQQ